MVVGIPGSRFPYMFEEIGGHDILHLIGTSCLVHRSIAVGFVACPLKNQVEVESTDIT